MLVGVYSFSNAQSMGDLTKAASSSAAKQAPTSGTNSFDVADITNQVMGVLSPKLKLTDTQKQKVNYYINKMLNMKKSTLPVAVSDEAGYIKRMTANRDLFPT